MSDIKAFLFDDDRGVSPVIGVILMVAITVILAAVIAAFVLGLGDTNETAPDVTWEYDFEDNAADPDNATSLTITHNGGETVDTESLEFGASDAYNPDVTNGGSGTDANITGNSGSLSAGDSVTLFGPNADVTPDGANGGTDASFDAGETVTIIFTSDDGGSSNIIGEFDVPDDYPGTISS